MTKSECLHLLKLKNVSVFESSFFAMLFSIVLPLNAAPVDSRSKDLTPTQTVISAITAEHSVYSENVKFNVKVVPTYVPGSLPSGMVQFFVDQKLMATETIRNNIATFTTSSLSASSHAPHQITAEYSGDSLYARSRDVIEYAVIPAPTTLAITSSINPSLWGEQVEFVVDVRAPRPALAVPQGMVQFQVQGGAPRQMSLNNDGSISFSSSDIEVGEHFVSVTFLGNDRFRAATGKVYQHVEKSATTITLTSLENPSPFGKSPGMVASVSSGLKGQVPSGEVQFQMNGQNVGSSVPLNEKGEAHTTLEGLNAGQHYIEAYYLGDAHFHASQHALLQKIEQAPTTGSLVSSKNPSVYGDKLALTVSITSDHAIPVGFIKFALDGTEREKILLDSSGHASYTLADIPAGKHVLTAYYLANANFKDSSTRLTQEVAKAETTAQISSSQNPSIYGSPIAFTAQVSSDLLQPKGSMQFSLDGKPYETKMVDASGRSSIQINVLNAGERKITANFLGKDNFQPSATALTQNVEKASVEMRLTSSGNPSRYGEPLSIQALVSSSTAKPVGHVQFTMEGHPAEEIALDANGVAMLTLPPLDAGSYPMSASFIENANFKPASEKFVQQVNPAETSLSLASSANPASFGSEIILYTHVAARKAKPQGSVELTVDGQVVATEPLDSNSQASVKLPPLESGAHAVSARYLGNANFTASSTNMQQTVAAKQAD